MTEAYLGGSNSGDNKIGVAKLAQFGAEITGVALAEAQSDDVIEQLRKLWFEHGVIVFRDQGELTEQQLVRFSRYFGELEIHVRREYLSPDNPEVLYVSNKTDADTGRAIGILSDHEVGWHHDQIYLERPALGSLLYSVEIPQTGGNTEFINLANAYDALPADTKAQLAELRAVQSYAYFNGQWSEPTSEDQASRTPDIDHPLIRTHPETGRKAIYADPGMTVRIKQLGDEQSRELLDTLYKHAITDRFRYSHEWRLGDAIMWDNASTMHRRGEFDSEAKRLMKRTTILAPQERAMPF